MTPRLVTVRFEAKKKKKKKKHKPNERRHVLRPEQSFNHCCHAHGTIRIRIHERAVDSNSARGIARIGHKKKSSQHPTGF